MPPASPSDLDATRAGVAESTGGPAPGVPNYATGDLIAGKYRLLARVAEGGMGAIWRARNSALDVEVAIKLIRTSAATAESELRLEQEARAAARLDHPSIVRVFDLGHTDQGDPFIVMELLRGRPLSELLCERKKLPPEDAVALLLPVAAALVSAHGKGIVHRDLKPDNILLVEGDDGSLCPKIVDFGIARVQDDDARGRVTRAGTLVGSPGYMSPEQARGRADVDERSDVWSLAVVLYEAIAGREAFQGSNYNALIAAILEEEPPPFAQLGVDDEALWSIVQGGLRKRREERTASARELGQKLAEWALDRGIEADVTGASLRRTWIDEPVPRSSSRSGDFSPISARFAVRSSAPGAPPAGGEPPAPSSGRATQHGISAAPSSQADRPRWAALGLLPLFAAAVAAAWALGRLSGPSPAASPPPASQAAASALAAPHPAAEPPAALPASSPAPPPTGSAAPAASAPAPARALSTGEITACVTSVFPARTFLPGALLGFVCKDPDARHASASLKSEVIKGSRSGKATEAMREHALLGWYEMAALAALRGRCCPGAAPLTLPASPGRCEGPEAALAAISAGVAARDEGDVADAVTRYTTDVSCVISGGAGERFGLAPSLKGGERAALERLLARLR